MTDLKKYYIILISSFIVLLSFLFFYIFEVLDSEIIAKITLFVTTIIAFILSYITALKKKKNGLTNGLIIGISIAIVSLGIHYFFKSVYFDTFFIRALVFITSSAAGGIIGVNKETS